MEPACSAGDKMHNRYPIAALFVGESLESRTSQIKSPSYGRGEYQDYNTGIVLCNNS